MAQEVRRTHPEVLVLAELPYQLASRHPHAESYRIAYAANPSCIRSADIIFFRCTGLLDEQEAGFLRRWVNETKQAVVLTYRTYSDWCLQRPPEEVARLADLYAQQAMAHGNGFGFYSWNEMGDTHLAPSCPPDMDSPGALTPEQSREGVGLMAAMVARYLDLAGQ